MFQYAFTVLALLFQLCTAAQAEPPPAEIRVGVLAFGTVAWEIAAIENEGLASAAGVKLVTSTLASPEAAKIALQGNTVDLIVADWIWVARQRGQGADFTFFPYSTSHGALVVPPNSPIRSVADLAGKKLGVAGGGIDKNWLLLQVLAQQKYQIDLARSAEIAFGAPPLLNQQVLQGRLNALLNYWHYAALLEAQGYRRILDGRGLLRELGVEAELANLGYVFRASWAAKNGPALRAYLSISEQARNQLCEVDSAWQKVAPLTGESDVKITGLLRQRYCDGRVKSWGEAEIGAADRVFALLKEVGGAELTGTLERLPAGVFWSARRNP